MYVFGLPLCAEVELSRVLPGDRANRIIFIGLMAGAHSIDFFTFLLVLVARSSTTEKESSAAQERFTC